MNKRKTVYTNLLRGQLKFKFGYNLLRLSPLFFLYFLLLIFFDSNVTSILFLVLSSVLVFYRFVKFQQLHDIASLLELEISINELTLVSAREDYTISFDQIKAVGLRVDPANTKNIDIFLQVEDESIIDWPDGLKEISYLRIPMIFEDHSLDMLDDNPALKDKCKNYQTIKRSVESDIF